MKPELTDSRRLTGANLFWDHPSAIIDIAFNDSLESLIPYWEKAVRVLLDGIGYASEQTAHRLFEGGASLLISAPVDVLYSMCELNESAWESALSAWQQNGEPESKEHFQKEIDRLESVFEDEAQPELLALQRAAREKNLPFLWDDDEVSIGYGKGAGCWPREALPAVDDLDWCDFGAIPVVLVTGTNGKSTTVRMAASIISAAGKRAGLTSTDFIRVADRTIDTGDYSGTGGARMLMRQPDVETAVLEVARGGLLRRGLGVEHANAALVTNVASDHLGEYGINTVEDLRSAKFIVRRALRAEDPLILCADDAGVRAYAGGLSNRLVWFSLDARNPTLRKHQAAGGRGVYLKDGWLMVAEGQGDTVSERPVVDVSTVPAARGGVVRYNISNAMGAMCIALELGLPDAAIQQGLADFQCDETDNPGRGNWFEHRGVRILVDFAHNPHGVAALADVVRRFDADRVVLLLGQAGDRLDQDIEDMTLAGLSMKPNELLICDLPGYERGREPYAVAHLIRDIARESGVAESAMTLFSSPIEAIKQALGQARAGDLLVFLALTQREQALALIHDYMADDG